MQSLIESQWLRKTRAPKKRAVKRVSDDEHLRAEPANQRALNQGMAQIEHGETIRFNPRSLTK
jgi:hypothetical protein